MWRGAVCRRDGKPFHFVLLVLVLVLVLVLMALMAIRRSIQRPRSAVRMSVPVLLRRCLRLGLVRGHGRLGLSRTALHLLARPVDRSLRVQAGLSLGRSLGARGRAEGAHAALGEHSPQQDTVMAVPPKRHIAAHPFLVLMGTHLDACRSGFDQSRSRVKNSFVHTMMDLCC